MLWIAKLIDKLIDGGRNARWVGDWTKGEQLLTLLRSDLGSDLDDTILDLIGCLTTKIESMDVAALAQEAVNLAQHKMLEWYETELSYERGSSWCGAADFLALCNELYKTKACLQELRLKERQ